MGVRIIHDEYIRAEKQGNETPFQTAARMSGFPKPIQVRSLPEGVEVRWGGDILKGLDGAETIT